MFLKSGSNVFEAHGFIPQSSSLIKNPRYFTAGASNCGDETLIESAFCRRTGTSAHQRKRNGQEEDAPEQSREYDIGYFDRMTFLFCGENFCKANSRSPLVQNPQRHKPVAWKRRQVVGCDKPWLSNQTNEFSVRKRKFIFAPARLSMAARPARGRRSAAPPKCRSSKRMASRGNSL